MPSGAAIAFICPETGQSLEPMALDAAERGRPRPLRPIARVGSSATPVGRTPLVMLRSDGRRAYPIVDGTPVLLVPEALVEDGSEAVVDLTDRKYAEAYEERDHYDRVAMEESRSIAGSQLSREIELLRSAGLDPERFPSPRRMWIDAPYETTAQWRAFEHLAPLTGKTLIQLGGRGANVVKLLFAGLREAWLVTPMLGEALYAKELAHAHGVAERLTCVVGIAEELPFEDSSFDLACSVGCVHHMTTALAFGEIARVLRTGGRFAAVEPWRSPGYDLGTRLLGKREEVHCKPLADARVAPLRAHFGWSHVSHHSTITRYPMLALGKLGVWVGMDVMWWLSRADDMLCSIVSPLRKLGSAVAVLAVKT